MSRVALVAAADSIQTRVAWLYKILDTMPADHADYRAIRDRLAEAHMLLEYAGGDLIDVLHEVKNMGAEA